MRRIYLISPQIITTKILYDGVKTEKHRREFPNIESMLDAIPECIEHYKPKKTIEIYFEGYTLEQRDLIKSTLKRKLPKARFTNN